MRHLTEHNIIAENQHAFRKARSCETQLILTTHDLTKNLDNRLNTDMAVLDFSKAFDVMPHHRLLLKLDHYGIRNKTKKWICSFLTKRFQRVVVNGKTSEWQPVLSGAPQGTVLGPHLFLVLINDIHENVQSCTRLFADDCLLYNIVKSTDDEAVLQRDLDQMVNWSHKWGMRFNPAKCSTLHLTRDRQPGQTKYEMMGTVLEETDETKYLGIFLQKDLRWNRQTEFATGKATKVLNFVRRNFYHVKPAVKEKLYHTLIRPHLDYATAAWDPHTSKNIKSIERVQKRAARFVTNTYGRDTSISNILASLGWSSMQERRKQHRLSCLHKMINGKLDIDYLNYIQPKLARARRGHDCQFQQTHSRTDAFANSFFMRTVPEWNQLAPETVIHTDPVKFKTALTSSTPTN